MNHDDAKKVLRRYRPGTVDAEDPEVVAALQLAREDAELASWLEHHRSRQAETRQAIRQVSAPAGLLEQIVSEHNSREKIIHLQRRVWLLAAAAMVAIIIGVPFWLRPRPPQVNDEATFAIFQQQAAAWALRGYGMGLATNDLGAVHGFLVHAQAPADYALSASLQKATLIGCAAEYWKGMKVSMLCFRTGQPLANGAQNDLWLFVVDAAKLSGVPAGSSPQFAQISRMASAAWNQDGKLYLLGTTADDAVLRKFL